MKNGSYKPEGKYNTSPNEEIKTSLDIHDIYIYIS